MRATLSAGVATTATFTAAQGLTVTGAAPAAEPSRARSPGIASRFGRGVATGDCNEVYDGPVSVTLTAVPAPDRRSAGGAALRRADLTVIMSEPRAVVATFNGATSGSQSAVAATPASGHRRAGSSTITVTVAQRHRGAAGGPTVTLRGERCADDDHAAPAATDANGVATGSVTSNEAGCAIRLAQAAHDDRAAGHGHRAAAAAARSPHRAPSRRPPARFGQAMATLRRSCAHGFANPSRACR